MPSMLLVFLVLSAVLSGASAYLHPVHASLSPQGRYSEEQEKPQPKVLVLSLPRSGSTFVGELFRNNPESAYLYEATRIMGDAFQFDECAAQPSEAIASTFTQMMQCNYTAIKDLTANVSKRMGHREHVYSWKHIEQNSAPDKCTASEHMKQMMVTKEITFWAPKLKWMLKTLGSSFKIVWLVRDLRGFISSFIPLLNKDSRENFYQVWQLDKADMWKQYDKCMWHDKDQQSRNEPLKALLSDINATPYKRMAAWWIMEQLTMLNFLSELPQDNWMLLRYEDLSLYPLEVTQQMYSFLGKDVVHENVLNFILQSTHSKNSTDSSDRYGTHRDSAHMSNVFLERIPKDILGDIEYMAGPLMEYFGYERTITPTPGPPQPTIFFRV